MFDDPGTDNMPDDELQDERRVRPGPANSRAPGETEREGAYLKELVLNQARVLVKLRSGEEVAGYVEYYDKAFIRLTPDTGPNLFIFKHDIKYLREEQSDRGRARESRS